MRQKRTTPTNNAFPKAGEGGPLAVDEDAIFKSTTVGENMYPHNKNLTSNAQNLRKNMTPEERHLWYDFLKKLPITVKRQYVVGSFILDFFIPSANVAIELDGSQHFEPVARESDRLRDEYLNNLGIKVLRYTNLEIKKQFDAVAGNILYNIGLDFKDVKHT